MRGGRRGSIGLLASAAVTLALGTAAVAWACTPAATVGSINPEEGPPGARVSMTATDFNPGPVEIRWNDTAGSLLATAQGPSFSVQFTVPQASPGTYTVLAVQRVGGSIVGKAPVAFEVTPAAATDSGGHVSSPGGGASDGGQADSGTTVSSEATSRQARGNNGGSASAAAASGGGGAAFPAEASAKTGSVSGGSGAVASPAAGTAASGTPRAGAPGVGTAQRSAGANMPASAVAVEDRTASADPGESGGPSQRSVAADLWGGFEEGTLRGAPLFESPTSSSPGSSLAPGAIAFSVALVALFGGFGIAELRRRRTPVASFRDQSSRPE